MDVERVPAILARAQNSIAEREGILREIVSAGWELDYAGVSLREDAFVNRIGASGMLSYPDRFGTQQCILLYVYLWRGGVMMLYAEDPGHGIEVSLDRKEIPTPDEAAEMYGTKLLRGRVVTREYWYYEPERADEATW